MFFFKDIQWKDITCTILLKITKTGTFQVQPPWVLHLMLEKCIFRNHFYVTQNELGFSLFFSMFQGTQCYSLSWRERAKMDGRLEDTGD